MVGTDDYLPPEVRDLKDGSGNPFNPEKVDIFHSRDYLLHPDFWPSTVP